MNKFFKAVMVFALVLCASVTAFGCGPGGLIDNRTRLDTPECVYMDSFLYWDSITGAEGYIVTVNGEDQPMQTSRVYYFEDKDSAVKVRAVAKEEDKNYKDSKKSKEVVRSYHDYSLHTPLRAEDVEESDDEFFSDEEIELKDSVSYMIYGDTFVKSGRDVIFVVHPSVRNITLYDCENYWSVGFRIINRTEPLTVECRNVSLVGHSNMPIFYTDPGFSGLTEAADIVFRTTGKTSMIGGRSTLHGSPGSYSDGFAEGGNGENGDNGYAAIEIPTVCFFGEKGMNISGGKGANGGDGGDSKGNNGGDGGNGGTGGMAVKASKIYVNIPTGEPIVLSGGAGGSGGKKGEMENILGGIFGGSLNSARDGANGAYGTPTLAEKIIIAGTIDER